MDSVTLLIVDKNPNVRHFLGRELSAAGFHVVLAENARDAMEAVSEHPHVRLAVIDPDLPDNEKVGILERLNNRMPYLPLIVHTFSAFYNSCSSIPRHAVFIEKQGNSIEHIKDALAVLLGTEEAI